MLYKAIAVVLGLATGVTSLKGGKKPLSNIVRRMCQMHLEVQELYSADGSLKGDPVKCKSLEFDEDEKGWVCRQGKGDKVSLVGFDAFSISKQAARTVLVPGSLEEKVDTFCQGASSLVYPDKQGDMQCDIDLFGNGDRTRLVCDEVTPYDGGGGGSGRIFIDY